PQGVRRPLAARHVGQGRDGAHDRGRRRDRGDRVDPRDPRRRRASHREPRAARRRLRRRRRRGLAAPGRRGARRVELVRVRRAQRLARVRARVTAVPIAGHRSNAVTATIREVDGRRVGWFRIAGGRHHGAIGEAGGDAAERLVRLATDLGFPVVGVLDTSGAELGEGVVGLDASGVVPTVLVVVGACVSGPALLLGLVDHVVMTTNGFAYVSGPDSVAEFTGIDVSRVALGGAPTHDRRTGVTTFVVEDEAHGDAAVAHLLDYLPSNHLEDPPWY